MFATHGDSAVPRKIVSQNRKILNEDLVSEFLRVRGLKSMAAFG
jgi:hypothetical protein